MLAARGVARAAEEAGGGGGASAALLVCEVRRSGRWCRCCAHKVCVRRVMDDPAHRKQRNRSTWSLPHALRMNTVYDDRRTSPSHNSQRRRRLAASVLRFPVAQSTPTVVPYLTPRMPHDPNPTSRMSRSPVHACSLDSPRPAHAQCWSLPFDGGAPCDEPAAPKGAG